MGLDLLSMAYDYMETDQRRSATIGHATHCARRSFAGHSLFSRIVRNPTTPEEQARRARLGRRREVATDAWRNPALTADARRKLSAPRKHSGPLADAIDKLGQGLGVADLTPAEQAAFRAHQAALRAQRKDEINAQARERYRRQQASLTDAEREAQRAKWRQANQRRAQKGGPASG